MKPSFALNLSHDGISLLHRARGGWHAVGDVQLDVADLAGELAYLRKKASDLSSSGLASKLIIPNSQILYRQMPDPGEDMAARTAAIHADLEGATPYALDEIAYDWSAEGGVLFVAAVARETLDEAESFAAEHRFNPASYAAIPELGTFIGEPFFGPAKGAAALLADGDEIERDQIATKILAGAPVTIEAAQPQPIDQAKASAPRTATDTDAAILGEPGPELRHGDVRIEEAPDFFADLDAQTALAAAPERKSTTSDLIAKAQPAEPDQTSEPALAREDHNAADVAPEHDPAIDAAPIPTPEPTPEKPAPDDAPEPSENAFVSRRIVPPNEDVAPRLKDVPSRIGFGAAPEIGGATRASKTTHMSVNAPGLADEPKAAKPEIARKAKPAKPKPGPLPEPPPVPSPRAPKIERPDPISVAAPSPISASSSSGVTIGGARTVPPIAVPPAPSSTAPSVSAIRTDAKGAPPLVPPRTDFNLPGSDSSTAALSEPEAPIVLSEKEAQSLTVFGARRAKKGEMRGKPKNLGLILIAGLVVGLVLLAWLSSFLVESDPQQSSGPGPDAGIDAPERASPDFANADPALPNRGSAPIGQADTARLPAPSITDSAPAPIDLGAPAAVTAPAPNPQTAQIETPAERSETVARQYAATGIWPLTPDSAPLRERQDRVEDVYIASIDPTITGQDAVALPAAGPEFLDNQPGRVTGPAPAGSRFALDARGLVIATPEGALTPDGIRVFAGRPPVVTAYRAEAEVAARAQLAQDASNTASTNRLRAFRPTLRPGDLVEQNERATFGGLTRLQIASIRPQARPASVERAAQDAQAKRLEEAALAASAAQADEAARINAAAAAQAASAASTALTEAPLAAAPAPEVIRISRAMVQARPSPRPRNFEKTVAAAQARRNQPNAPRGDTVGTGETAAVVAAAAPRAPSIPTSASVARQATVKNAINLNKINLIGVYSSGSQRRALVRLRSGRYVKVKVGDRIDGGRVRAIGKDALIYTKNGRDVSIELAG